MSKCFLPSSSLTNSTLAAIQCSQPMSSCFAICANPDVSGVGVRIAFYAQSVISALLVVISPRDSVASAWAGTLLTIALVVAAIVQKVYQDLTLHHATLVMNFATLSCISSLAVAPKLPVWNLRPQEYIARRLAPHANSTLRTMDSFAGRIEDLLNSNFSETTRQRLRYAQRRERIAIGLSLLFQVALQWTWAIILFVWPNYSQQECSEETLLMLFMRPVLVRDIDVGGKYAIWPCWLLTSLGITLALSINLVVYSASRAHEKLPDRPSPILRTENTLEGRQDGSIGKTLFSATSSWIRNMPRKPIFSWLDFLWLTVWLLYIIASELQIRDNCVFAGENEIKSFGQITAVLLILSPLWSLVIALWKYPRLLRRQKNIAQGNDRYRHSQIAKLPTTPSDVRDGEGDIKRK